MRVLPLTLCLALLLWGCGSGETSMDEYTEQLDAVFQRGIQQYEELVATPQGRVLIVGQGAHLGFADEGAQLTDFTPQDLHVVLARVAEIQDEALDAAADIEPPEQIAELHALYFRRLPIAELAVRAETATDWEELSDSPEMAAYRAGLAADREVCDEFQAKLDAMTEAGAFTDVPWMPSELKDIAEYALGCSSLVQNPEDAYRP